mgnify:CR=1 FL=1
MNRHKKLFSTKINGYDKCDRQDIEFSVYGIFDTQKVKWDYYVISSVSNTINKMFLTFFIFCSVYFLFIRRLNDQNYCNAVT